MDIIIDDESPLAAYLEGKGEAEVKLKDALDQQDRRKSMDDDTPTPSYTPWSPDILPDFSLRSARLFQRRTLARAKHAYTSTITSTLGSADNERFLEHFRYILIASQLLNDHVAPGTFQNAPPQAPTPSEYGPAAVSLRGAALAATVAFFLVYAVHWSRSDKSRVLVVSGALLIAGLLVYGYVRRQWLQHLRHETLTTTSAFVMNAQAFEATSTATLSMIQEVELVSRGYNLTVGSPLPPISRLETSGPSRQCLRLRRKLYEAYNNVLPICLEAARVLCPCAKDDDLERFLEVYDIREEDLVEAATPSSTLVENEVETLRNLRTYQSHLTTLRRLIICTLLSIEATGRKEDAPRWRIAIQEMEKLSTVLGQEGQSIAKLLHDEQNPPMPPSPGLISTPTTPNTHTKSQSQAQSRRIAQMSSGIRSIQARLYLFREDSTRALSTSTSENELLPLSTSLKEQYDAIGSDLRALMHAWETGRRALVDDITRNEKRIHTGLTPRSGSSPSSMSGLAIVMEDENVFGSLSPRTAAYRSLSGERPFSPPLTETGSEDESSKDDSLSKTADDEVFEAVVASPLPRQRSTLTREERIKKMHEAREQQAMAREKRELSGNMIRELQTVIKLRPQRRDTSGASGTSGTSGTSDVSTPATPTITGHAD